MTSIPSTGPFFLPIGGGQRFCFFHAPASLPMRGSILAIHPFAEEMNKSRAAMADGARAFAAAGYAVLQIDLLGCGDSSGDFADATWAHWLGDLAVAWDWLDARSSGERWLWGTRMGSLLAEQFVAKCSPSASGLLLWQPVVNGAQHLGQFLRLKTVGNMLRQSSGSATASSAAGSTPAVAVVKPPQSPRSDLAAGRTVEVAGYHLTPSLADSMELARMGMTTPKTGRVVWLEVTAPTSAPSDSSSVTVIAARVADTWRTAGSDVVQAAVSGPQFWQTQEVTRCPPLVAASVAELERA